MTVPVGRSVVNVLKDEMCDGGGECSAVIGRSVVSALWGEV